MIWFYSHYVPTEANLFYLQQKNCMRCFSTIVRLGVLFVSFLSPLDEKFCDDMLFILFLCVVYETPNSVWKRATTSYKQVMTALSILSLHMVLAILLERSIAAFLNVTSVYYPVLICNEKQNLWPGAYNGFYCECYEVHLDVCGWGCLTRLFHVRLVLLILRFYNDRHQDTMFWWCFINR